MTLLFKVSYVAWSLLFQGDQVAPVALLAAASEPTRGQAVSDVVADENDDTSQESSPRSDDGEAPPEPARSETGDAARDAEPLIGSDAATEPSAPVKDPTEPVADEAPPSVAAAPNAPAAAKRDQVVLMADPPNRDQADYADFAMSLLEARRETRREQAPRRVEVVEAAPPVAAPIEKKAAPATPPTVTLTASPRTEFFSMAMKTTKEMTFDSPIDRVSVEDPKPVGVHVLSPTRIMITGNEIGATTLTVESGGETQSFFVRVEPNLELVRSLVASIAPTAEIELRSLNGTVFLTGRVPDTDTAELIKGVASAAAGDSIVSTLKVAGVQQVMLRVVVAEVNKEATRQLGVNWAIGASDWSRDFFFANNLGQLNPTTFGSTGVADVTTGQNLFGVAPVANGGTANVTFGFPRAEFQIFLNALRENGLARTLAEPNLVAISGQTATFLVGGEVPLSVVSSSGGTSTVSIFYKEFGIRLAFTPTTLGEQLVRLHVMSEVSEPVPSSVSSGGLPVFSFETRRVETTIECGNGQTFAIAGLLSEDVSAIASKIPGLGDIPVLGALFSSTSYQREETELVVLVTPQLVEPLDPDQVPDPPGANMTDPTDFELFALQKLEGASRVPASDEIEAVPSTEANDPMGANAETADPTTLARTAASAFELRGPWGFATVGDGS